MPRVPWSLDPEPQVLARLGQRTAPKPGSAMARVEGACVGTSYGQLPPPHGAEHAARSRRWLPARVRIPDEAAQITSVASGWRHSMCVDSTGVVYSFGWSKYGQLGHGDLL